MEHYLPDELARIDAALEKTKGHRAAAARLLGITPQRVYTALRNDPAMRIKWGLDAPEVPEGEVSEIDRPPPAYSKHEDKLAVAITNQDKLLAKGWDKLGVSKEESEFLATLESSYADNTASTLSLAYGGIAHTFVKLLFQQAKLEQQLKEIDDNPDAHERTMTLPGGYTNIVKTAHEFRLEVYDRYLATSNELRRLKESVEKSALVKAQVEKLKAEAAGGGATKMGWSKGGPPVAVQINAGAGTTVKVNEPSA